MIIDDICCVMRAIFGILDTGARGLVDEEEQREQICRQGQLEGNGIYAKTKAARSGV